MNLEKKQSRKKEDIRIILVSLQRDAERVPPVGLVYIATYLNDKLKIPKKNIKVVDSNYFDVEKEVEEFNPDVIGIGVMTINYQNPVNFFDESSNSYQQINQTIFQLPTNHPSYSYGYRYGVEKGKYKVYFKPDIGETWEVGINVSNIVLRYDLTRSGYLDYSDMSYQVLQTPTTDSVDLSIDKMNHTGVFMGTNIEYAYEPGKMKEKIL